jgi:folate-binding protein YgfZ
MSTPSSALPALPFPSGVVRLHDWGVIRAAGPDARSFLHSQLTQDMLHLEASQARLAGFCSAKGRLQASFVVWRNGTDDVLLACSADLLPAVLKRLSMFVLRAKCKLSDASADVALHGLAGDAAGAWLGDVAGASAWSRAEVHGVTAIRMPDAAAAGTRIARWLLAVPTGVSMPPLPVMEIDAWRWLEARSATARITAATAEQFVPQMVNFELVGGVNFQKGCYPGQEVVARSQYRGTLKRRGAVLTSDVALQAGQEIFHSADPGQPAGMVVLSGSAGGEHAALAELKLAALEGGSLHAGSAEGPLLRAAGLPYAIPLEAP